MLEEQMIDMEGDYGEMWVRSWRCFNCGHRDDAVLQHHRQRYAKPVVENPQPVTVDETIEWVWDSEEVEPLAA